MECLSEGDDFMIDKLSRYKTFASVAKNKSVSLAAKELFVSQPAVSAEIKALEDELKTTLFFRTNRGMNLTTEGQLLENYIKGAFAYIDAAENALHDTSDLKCGTLRIGASDMTLRFFLLDYIDKFCEKFPNIKLNITNNATPETISALKNGKIDFGVVSEPFDIDSKQNDGIEFFPLKKIQDVFICKEDSPLAKMQTVNIEQLQSQRLIMLEKQTSTRRYLQRTEGYEGLEADIELATSDLIIEFVKKGLGIATVVEDFAKEAIEKGEVCKISLLHPIPNRRFILIYHKNIPLSAAAQRIVNYIKNGEM